MRSAAARRGENPSSHAPRYTSEGFTREGRSRQQEAWRTGLCASCGTRFRPDTAPRTRRWCCGPGCADRFYEDHFRSWRCAERGAIRRNREAHGGAFACDGCGGPARPYVKLRKGIEIYRHRGYEVDHKVEIAAGGDPFDPRNLWVLCLRCHRLKTRRFVGSGGGRRARTRGKVPSTPGRLIPLEAFG